MTEPLLHQVTEPLLHTLAEVRVLGRSPLGAVLRVQEALWKGLPDWATALPPVSSYGHVLHALVLARGDRRMSLGTFFFRNRPELDLIRRLALRAGQGGRRVRIAVLGCSNGAEVYSIVYTIRSAHPELELEVNAVDLSAAAVAEAREGAYPLGVSGLVHENELSRTRPEELRRMFDADGGVVRVKPAFREGIAWHVGDVGDERLAEALGRHDLVIANRFLCHLEPARAEALLRRFPRWVAPGGHLFVSGVDLDVRTRVAGALRWTPVLDSLEAIHDGDDTIRKSWPTKYWGLEPLDKRRPDWTLRYASAFAL